MLNVQLYNTNVYVVNEVNLGGEKYDRVDKIFWKFKLAFKMSNKVLLDSHIPVYYKKYFYRHFFLIQYYVDWVRVVT